MCGDPPSFLWELINAKQNKCKTKQTWNLHVRGVHFGFSERIGKMTWKNWLACYWKN
jgi:hypothetical protein